MRHLSDWSSDDDSLLLNFSNDVLQVFSDHVQSDAKPESGGVLLGTVHAGGLLISVATKPTRRDLQFLYLFERLPYGHRAIAHRLWRDSGGLTRYIGEWHTHPQDVPSPSALDLNEWSKLAKVRVDERPLLAVIVGRRDLHVELTYGDGRRQLLQAC